LKFEDLVSRPRESLEQISNFLGVEFHSDMLQPYKDGAQRMTDGIHAESRMLGDVKFHSYKGIEANVAERWKEHDDRNNLAEETQETLALYGIGQKGTDEFGTRGETNRAEFAQVNLASVLFAVVNEPVSPAPELRTPKIPEEALISIPPFKVTGQIHLMPERSLRDALSELTGHFLPVTDATYWSDSLGV